MNSQKENDHEKEKILDEENPKSTRTTVVFEGHTYDLEDGRLVSYIEIYIPILRKYIRIDACDLFKYVFGRR